MAGARSTSWPNSTRGLRAGRDLVQHPPHRRGRGDRTEHLALVAQHVDVGDRLPTVDERQRHIGQDDERRAIAFDNSLVRPTRSASSRNAHCPRAPPRPSRHRSQTTQPITRYASPLNSFLAGELEPSQVQASPDERALRCFYAPIRQAPRKRSGLARKAYSAPGGRVLAGPSHLGRGGFGNSAAGTDMPWHVTSSSERTGGPCELGQGCDLAPSTGAPGRGCCR